MISIHTKVAYMVALLFSSLFCQSQTNEIKIKFIGNCGLHLSDGSSNIYIDFPYKSGAYGYMNYDQTELDSVEENSIFLFTHRHADHYSKKLVKKLKSKHKGNVYSSWNQRKLEKLNNSIDDFKVEAFKTKHRYTLRHYSYVITWHGKRIFLSGDTETAETAASLKDIDWAFVPSWIMFDAREKNLEIDFDKIAIYHLYPKEVVTNARPEKIIILEKQGTVINIPY